MQFLRRFTSHVGQNVPKIPKTFSGQSATVEYVKRSRYTPEAEHIMKDTLVPGPYLRFLKNKKPKSEDYDQTFTLKKGKKKPPPPKQKAPKSVMDRTAHTVEKAVVTVHSLEPLPTPALTYIDVLGVKVSNKLTQIKIYYQVSSHVKTEEKRQEVFRALEKHKVLMSRLIHKYTHLKPTTEYKFVHKPKGPYDTLFVEAFEKLEKELATGNDTNFAEK